MTKVQSTSTSTSTDINNNVQTQEVYMNKSDKAELLVAEMRILERGLKTRGELLVELNKKQTEINELVLKVDALEKEISSPECDDTDDFSGVQSLLLIALAEQRGISVQIAAQEYHEYSQPGQAPSDFLADEYGAIKHEDFDKQVKVGSLYHQSLKEKAEARDEAKKQA